MKRLYLWSKRTTTAQGLHWKMEREVQEDTKSEWLRVFQKDEPGIEFKVSSNKPRIK